jgi:hypothetical protein
MNRGKITILFILVVAVLMGGSAWLYQFQRGRQLQKAWGMDNLLLIHQAPQVELITLTDTKTGARNTEFLTIEGRDWPILERIEIGETDGLINARAPLVQDHSFLWTPNNPKAPTQWAFAIRFSDAKNQTTLAFSTEQERIILLENNSIVAVKPKLMESFKQFAHAVRTIHKAKKEAESSSEPN